MSDKCKTLQQGKSVKAITTVHLESLDINLKKYSAVFKLSAQVLNKKTGKPIDRFKNLLNQQQWAYQKVTLFLNQDLKLELYPDEPAELAVVLSVSEETFKDLQEAELKEIYSFKHFMVCFVDLN